MQIKIILFLLFYTVMDANAFYSKSSIVVDLNKDNFDTLVTKGKELWVVEFFVIWCGHCKTFKADYEKVAKAFEGIIKFGAVNADENTNLVQEHDIRGYPTIKLFNGHKGTPEVYDGDYQLKALVSFLEVAIHSQLNSRLDGNLDPSMFKSKHTTQLTEDNFENVLLKSKEMWLVAFYSPFSELCKNLSIHWTKISEELTGIVKLGSLDATVNFDAAATCNIAGYPTIQFFPPNKKKTKSGINYNGEGEANAIIQWTLERISENVPTSKVVQIIDFSSLQAACDKKPICIVSILPSILDCQADCRNEYLDMLSKLSEKHKKSLWGWVWSEAGAQPEIETALEINGGDYPIMTAVNVKKMKFASFSKKFLYEDVDGFLNDLSFERDEVKSITLTEFPDIKKIQPWDGLNAQAPGGLLDNIILTQKDEL